MREFFEREKPDALIHAAAYTAVDRAEEERELAFAVNEGGTRALARLCKEFGTKMLYLSTDYVFSGEGDDFYETDAKKNPQNVYGASKLAGERAIEEILEKYFIVRISWVFGVHGKNFIRTMLQLAEMHKELQVVDDQIGSPTYTKDLAELLLLMVQTEKYGIYHATNEGVCSWADFAEEIFRQAGKQIHLHRVPSSAYPTKACRPTNSRMSKKSLDLAGFSRLPSWQDALARYLEEIRAESAICE